MDWKANFFEQIRVRNALAGASIERVFETYQNLYQEFVKIKNEYVESKRDFRRRVSTNVEEKLVDSEMTEDYVRRISELQDQVHGLNEELRLSYRTNVSRSEDLIKMKTELKKMVEVKSLSEKELEKEKIENHNLRSEIDDLVKTVEAKNKTVQILVQEKGIVEKKYKDQRSKLDRLNKDYDAIVQSVLDGKQKLIDRINENNELQVQLSKKMEELDQLKRKYRSQSKTKGSGRITKKDRKAADDVEDSLQLQPPAGVDQRIKLETVGNSIMFSPSGQYFAVGCDDRTVKVFSLSTRTLVNNFRGGQDAIVRVRFSPDDELILGTSTDSSIRIWNFREKRMKLVLTGHQRKVFAADFSSRDQKRIATGSHDRTIKIWDMYRGTLQKTMLIGSSVNDLEISSSSLVFSAHFDKSVKIHDLRTYKKVSELKNIHEQQVTSVNVSSNERMILTAGRDSMIRVFDFRTQKQLALVNHDQYRNSVNYSKAVFSPCGTYATAGSHNGKLLIWNMKNGSTHKVYPKGHGGAIQGVDWSVAGDKIVTCGTDKSLVLWN